MTRTELQQLAHSHDSSLVRSRAAGIVVALDELAALLGDDTDAERARQRRLYALRAERFPTPPPTATL